MKRHKSLYPLSHDHHHALVQARKLRLAASDTTSDTTLPSLQEAAAAFLAFWEESLLTHFRQEEEILLPLFSAYVSTDADELIETLKQHVEIRREVRRLGGHVNQNVEPEAASLQQLATLLERHIRFEENHLFPAIEAAVPENGLWEMHRQLVERLPS